MTFSAFQKTFLRYSFLLPFLLALIFILLTAPGIHWGAPDVWNPDELVARVDMAFQGNWTYFDEINFDYPSLPKYIQYGLGWVIYRLGYGWEQFLVSARFLSVLLGGLVVALTVVITRKAGGGAFTAALAGLWMISNSELAINARFAHNDLYLLTFTTLTALFLLNYSSGHQRGWLYAAFFSVGLAASSKYNGGSLILVPLILLWSSQWALVKTDFLRLVEMTLFGVALSALGYILGTPKSILWLAFYLKRVLPALKNHATYGGSGTPGLFGQWDVLRRSLGTPMYITGLLGVGWGLLETLRRQSEKSVKTRGASILLLCLGALVLPNLFSLNYQARFFLTIYPLLAALCALMVEELVLFCQKHFKQGWAWAPVAAALVLAGLGMLRTTSIRLLFENDSRIAATRFVNTLPADSIIEYTLYPPEISKERFPGAHAYPIFFKKFPNQELPSSPYFKLNEGEDGILERKSAYLVIDSFTYDRFSDTGICSSNPKECQFFKRLLEGSTLYQPIAKFEYRLPGYMPNVAPAFINPTIQVFQRKG